MSKIIDVMPQMGNTTNTNSNNNNTYIVVLRQFFRAHFDGDGDEAK